MYCRTFDDENDIETYAMRAAKRERNLRSKLGLQVHVLQCTVMLLLLINCPNNDTFMACTNVVNEPSVLPMASIMHV